VYLRFTTRGAERCRRLGFSRARSRARNVRHIDGRSLGSWVLRGESTLLGDRLAHDPQGGGEADPVGVVPCMLSGVSHQRPDRVVATQMAPDLLQHQVGGLRAQHYPRAALVGLELVERGLDLPPLRVSAGELDRG